MKKVLLTHWTCTAIMYTAIYAAKTFIIWNIENPFKWLTDMPTYSSEDRACILFAVLLYQTIQFLIVNETIEGSREKSTKEEDK